MPVRNCLVLLLCLILFPHITKAGATNSNSLSMPKQFVFCYETKELLPHYAGDTPEVPKSNPGAIIEALHALDKTVADIEIKYVRQPWKRCLSDLQNGSVHGVVGRYTKERSKFARYPHSKGKVDDNRAFQKTSSCLIQHETANIRWDGNHFTMPTETTISIPSGYAIAKQLRSEGFLIYETNSPQKAHELLFSKRVPASIAKCNISPIPKGFVVNPIPISSNIGYLLISRKFYDQNPEHSEQIWNALGTLDISAFYDKYKD